MRSLVATNTIERSTNTIRKKSNTIEKKKTRKATPATLLGPPNVFVVYEYDLFGGSGAAGRLWGPQGRPRAPSWVRAPSLENFHQKTVTRKSTSRGTVWGSFWPKLVKSRAFKPNGRHEQFRSALFIGKSSVGCSKALTRTPFVTNRGVDFPLPRRIFQIRKIHPMEK